MELSQNKVEILNVHSMESFMQIHTGFNSLRLNFLGLLLVILSHLWGVRIVSDHTKKI